MGISFALALPDADALKQQKFDIMWHGKQSFQDVNRMSPLEREDFIVRLNKRLKEDAEEKTELWTGVSNALSSALGKLKG